ncbi:SLC13 family permease [Aquamicrobium sp. LC103]|uniref:SLC13 family permease n=1 Tax=Aquamicrobium sp. LC103 TaxID=1120658 RepID=UPI00063E7E47|nr:SLC13 family permease [Aquamicrobium sp. LC103]TKT75027.1 cation transporter [Aquamicrobium sp. LC103]
MTFEQAAIVILLCGMLVVFALDRIRMEIVALGGLALGAAFGLVPFAQVFSGFANPAVITVIEILLIVQALGRSRLLDRLASGMSSARMGDAGVLAVLCALTATLSVFMNNIGALALMIPVVFSVCRAHRVDPRLALMPVSFAALLGGVCSVIGTPANLIVSHQLALQSGSGFAFFDFAYAGVPAALAGLAVLVFWARATLHFEDEPVEPQTGGFSRRVVAELVVPSGSVFENVEVADFPLGLRAVRRAGHAPFVPEQSTVLSANDVLLVEADTVALDVAINGGSLRLAVGAGAFPPPGCVEAVVMPESTLIGSRVGLLTPFERRGVRVVAVAPQTSRVEPNLADLQLSIGDILYLDGDRQAIAEALAETEALSLAPSQRAVRTAAVSWLPLAVFAAGIAIAGFGLAAPEIAFGLVVLVLAAMGELNLRRSLGDLDWPILIVLAAMIPLGFAVETTGTAGVLASALLDAMPSQQPVFLVGAVLAVAVLITPFVNNASTAIVLSPIAIGIAAAASLPPEPFLIAVALGASIDFLTPFGHHNNMLIMGLGGYRFADFPKVGWPVTLVAFAAGLSAIALFWL